MAYQSVKSIDNLPSCLDLSDIYRYISDFDNLFAQTRNYIDSHLNYYDLVIDFSNEVLKEDNTVSDLLDEIRYRWPNLSKEAINRIIELLNDTHRDDFNIDSLIEQIGCEIRNDLDPNHDYDHDDTRNVFDDLRDIMSHSVYLPNKSSFLKLGCYFPDDNKIVLYTRAIEKNAKDNRMYYKDLFNEVLAHELLHWAHYEYARHNSGYDLLYRGDYTTRVLKESLATAFEERYCVEHSIFSDFSSTYRNSVAVHPYAGGKYLKDPIIFDTIFRESVFDSDKALREMLCRRVNEFYDVKNVVIIRYKKKPQRHKKRKAGSPIVINGPITPEIIEALLKSMGRGWFILKYAEDYAPAIKSNVSTNYGKPSSMKTRLSTYKSCTQYHNDIIDYLDRNRRKGKMSAGNPTLKCQDILKILDKITQTEYIE